LETVLIFSHFKLIQVKEPVCRCVNGPARSVDEPMRTSANGITGLARRITDVFISDDFLLDTDVARRLYHEVAAALPIIDYHAHLPPADIAARKRFRNITELWLGGNGFGDHYKWRLMRASGVPEQQITGSADDYDKFRAFCRVLPLAAGNPIYHWSHLELKRIFGIDAVINEANASRLWDQTNAKLEKMDTWSLMSDAKVEVSCTTDDPADSLAEHEQIAKSELQTRVLPAYRPDKAMRINAPGFIDYLTKLGETADVDIGSFADLLKALERRVAFFHAHGARLSDHALDVQLPVALPDDGALELLFARRRRGETLSDAEVGIYVAGLLVRLGRTYAAHDWTMCLHIGALRNINSRGLAALGADTGYDTIGELNVAAPLASLLDALDRDNKLPKTMLFCLNPTLNATLSTLTGGFQDGTVPGKIQFGPAWWFNDHKDGNLEQMKILANHGVLGTFVGMVTDSRSFASFPRHDYFRRLVCKLLGRWVADGEYPSDFDALATIVRGVSYQNAKGYFGI
jgi:glucuronate isomerase